jgi:hypothetical protein
VPAVSRPYPRRCRALLPTLAALTAAALLSACGSTVQVTSTRTVDGTGAVGGAGGALSDGTGLATQSGPGTSALTPTGGAGGTSATSGTTSPSGRLAPGQPAPGAAAPGQVAASAARAANLPAKGFGWDDKHVYFGVVTQNDAQKAFASFGASNVDPGNTLGQAQAVADAINKRGGILGRTLVLRTIDVATVDTATNPEATGQRVCTYFTQDHPVIGVVSVVTVMDYPNFRACLAGKHVPLFSATVKAADDKSAGDLAPYFTQTAAVSWTRLAPVLVTRLKAQGWFGGWNARTGTAGPGTAKVGIVTDSTAAGMRTGKLLTSELAKAGYPGALTFSYVNASDGQSASVNYFNQNGVTHVIVTDVELLAFESSAQAQGYRPRFGITSYNAPYTTLETSSLAPPGAQKGAMGVGWAPALDVAEARDPGASPGKGACQKVMTAGGQDLSGKRLAQVVAFSMCDVLQLVQQGAAASGALAGPALFRGIEAVAPRFPTAVGFSTALSGARHFVPGTARDLAYDAGCSCFRYAQATAGL